MNTEYLVKYLSSRLDLPEETTNRIFSAVIDSVCDELCRENETFLPGLGRLEVKSLPGRRTVFFHPNFESIIKNEEISEKEDSFSPDNAIIVFESLQEVLLDKREIYLESLGTFRCTLDGETIGRISFIPSQSLRLRLSGYELKTEKQHEPKTEKQQEQEIEEADKIEDINRIEEKDSQESSKTEKKVIYPVKKLVTEPVKITVAESQLLKGKMPNKKLVVIIMILLIFLAIFFIYKRCASPSLTQMNGEQNSNVQQGSPPEFIPDGIVDTTSLAVETLEGTLTLLDLSQRYYGDPCYWVYIFMENEKILKYPTNTPKNVRVVIPNLKVLGINPKDSTSIRQALQLGQEVMEDRRR